MRDFLAPVGVLHGQIKGLRVDGRHVHAPAFGRVGFGFLQRDELGEVGVVERVGLPHVAAGVELVEPDLARLLPLLEEEDDGLHACTLERAAWAIEHRVQIAALDQQLAQRDRGVVGVRQEGVLNHDARTATGAKDLDEVLEEEERGLARADREVLLDLRTLLAAERRIRQHDVEAVLLLDVGEVLRERIRVDDVRRLDPVEDEVHDRDHVGERLLLLPVEGRFLQTLVLRGAALWVLRLEIVKGLAKKARRSHGGIADRLARLGVGDLDDGANQRARGVILTAVASGVAHILDLRFVQVRELVLLALGCKAEFVDVVDDLAQVVSALDAVLYLAEDFADFVFDGVGAGGLGLETLQMRKEFVVYERDQVVAGLRFVVIDLAVFTFGRGPTFPAVLLSKNVFVRLARELGLDGLTGFKSVQILQEQKPR